MKIALAIIAKGSDEEAVVLERCIKNIEPYVDGVFVTVTNKEGEERSKKMDDMLAEHNVHMSYFTWENDFSTARNFNFKQVPDAYDYILWCDADDIFRGLDKLSDTIKEHPADSYILNYLYAFDEYKEPTVVHMKTQIIKNDGTFHWVGKLHEDFENKRQINAYFIEGIERLHLSDETRFDGAKERNLEIAKQQIITEPDDPRSYWNLGNSLKALGKDSEAIDAFTTFLTMSQSDDEKYIVYLRLAECYVQINIDKAIEMCRIAIGTKHAYPDAYITLGHILFSQRKYIEAAANYLTSLQLNKQKVYHKIIVFNPRDYDYVPMYYLSKCYFNLGRPDLAMPLLEACQKIYPKNKQITEWITAMKPEVQAFNNILAYVEKLEKITDKEILKKELDALPKEIASYPAICRLRNQNFVKETSSGKDVVFYCGQSSEDWTPETAKTKGIGGSEEAVIWLSRLLVQRGWNVTVYNSCGYKEQNFDGVIYKPFWMWNIRDKQDVAILWRFNLRFLDYDINSTKIYIDLHDVTPREEFTKQRLAKINGIFVKSQFHRELLPDISDDKFIIVPNGIDVDEFSGEHEKDPYLLVNTSSPDRSLSALIELFPEVKKEVPEATCVWAYGWNVYDEAYKNNKDRMEWKNKIVQGMQSAGIINLGRLGHTEVANLYKKARVFAYPSEFAEIDCISLSKAMAAGAIPVTTNFAAMGEKSGRGGFFIPSKKTKDTWYQSNRSDFSLQDKKEKKEWVKKTIQALKNTNETYKGMREWALKTFDWNTICDVWEKEFNKIK